VSFIARRLEILKYEIAVYHEKSQQLPDHSKGENWPVWLPVVFHWKKPELGQGEKPTNVDDVVT
jgi:hypothetical protein